MKKLKGFGLGSLLTAALLLVGTSAKAATYNLDGDFGVYVVDFNVVTSGSVVTGISGSISGYGDVSTYTGAGGDAGMTPIVSGLYTDPAGSPNTYTVQNPPLGGGVNLTIDNAWYSSDPHLDGNGIAFLMADGLTGGLWGNSSPGSYGLYLGNYNIYVTNGSAVVTATPLPPSWTMLLLGVAGLGFFYYRGTKSRPAVAAA